MAMENMESIEENIYKLEKDLLKDEVRQSSERINEILDDGFIEFCSSGEIYNYKRGDVFHLDVNSSSMISEIKDFAIKELSEGVILATYEFIRHDELREDRKYSLRSSIWKNLDGMWRMMFHQGTFTSIKPN